MRTILFILQKELKQVLRNRSMLPIILVMPIVQLLVLIHAVTYDVRNLRMVVVDNSRTPDSRNLVTRFVGSSFFILKGYAPNVAAAKEALNGNDTDLALVIPTDFAANQVKDGKANVQLLINSINTMQANLANGYASSIIGDYFRSTLPPGATDNLVTVDTRPRFWYNPTLNYTVYMFPGIMVVLITAIGLFLSGMNLVREKEIGTMEQINVTPIKKWQFIVGKMLPFIIIGLFEISIGILLGRIFYHIPFVGSIGLLYLTTFLYLLVVISMGTLISTVSDTQQQSMFISWFFMMMFLMMSGLFNIVESMPQWAIWLNKVNPIAYFIVIIRGVMLKGATLSDILVPLTSLGVFAILSTILSIRFYHKRA